MSATIPEELRSQFVALESLRDRSDRAFRRVVEGAVASPDYAARLAREVEYAEGDFDRAAYAAGFEPRELEAELRAEAVPS